MSDFNSRDGSPGDESARTRIAIESLREELKKSRDRCEELECELESLRTRYNVSEDRHRLLFQSAGIGIGYWTADGRLVSLNQVAEKRVGRRVSELIGMSFEEMFGEEQGRIYTERIREVVNSREARSFTDFIELSVGGRWYKSTYSPVVDDNGNVAGVQIVSDDISEKIDAEQRFEEWRRLTEYIIKHDPNAIAVYDKNLRYIFASERYLSDYRVSDKDIVGKHHYEVFPEMPQRWKDIHRRVLNGAIERSEDDYFERADGTIDYNRWECRPWYDTNGEIGGMITYTEVVTERKLAEEKLRESEQKFRFITENISDVIVTIDENSILTYISPSAERIIGRGDELIGRDVFEFIHPDDIEHVTRKIRRAFETGSRERGEYRYKHSDKGYIWLETTGQVCTLDGKRCALVSIRDITERKSAEEELRCSETLYRDLFEKNRAVKIVIDSMEGTIVDANPAACEFYGYDYETLTSLAIWDINTLGETKTREMMNRASAESKVSFEFKHRLASGEIRDVHVHSGPIEINGRILLHSIVIDITDRKEVEEALRYERDKSQQYLDIAGVIFLALDAEGVVTLVNPKGCEILGYSQDEIVGKNWFDCFLPAKDAQRVKEIQARIVAGECTALEYVENAVISHDGSERLIAWHNALLRDCDGRIVGTFSSGEDITERRAAQERIRQSEQKFRSYVDNAPDGIFVVNENGDYIEVNDRVCEMTGYSREELLSMKLTDLYGASESKRAVEHFETVVETGYSSGETAMVRKDGTERFWNVKAVKLSEDRFLGFVQDITEIIRLRDLQSRAERLELAGRIAGQVAHDFNNLLAPIVAYPEFIREILPSDQQSHALLDDIESAAKKIADINQDLLTMGRRGHFTQSALNMNDIVKQVVNELSTNQEAVVLALDLDDNLLNVMGGAAQIHRMITNLVCNALDAVRDAGKVSVTTTNYYADRNAVTSYAHVPRGEYVKLIIADTGCGISNGDVQKIFDPFFSTKTSDKRRGSGLGLSIVDAVVKDHGGYIDLQSETGVGTTFYIYFPVTRETAEPESSDRVEGGSERVLVVDDDEVQREVTTRLLRKLGYKVSTAGSGEEAVEALKVNPQDLVVLDMIMPPGIDGTDTYRRILELNPAQRAIIISGYSESDRVEEAQRLGAGEFVRKPLTLKVIAAALRRELGRFNRWEERPSAQHSE